MLHVFTNFDGAPPEGRVLRNATNFFAVKAFSETDSEALRLEIGIENDADSPTPIELEINWPSTQFSDLRDCFYWKHERSREWMPIVGQTIPGRSTVTFDVPSGWGLFCLQPRYGVDDLEKYVFQLKSDLLACDSFGESEYGRQLLLLRIGNPDGKRFLFTARNHPDESAGAFCIEGMVNFLLSGDPLAQWARREMSFSFVPMTNPDGVADGMSRYSSPTGADMNRTPEWNRIHRPGYQEDPVLNTCFGLYEQIQPHYFIDLHSNLLRFEDTICAADESVLDRFIHFMPDQVEYGKTWTRIIDALPDTPAGYCAEKFGTVPLLLKLPWFMRNAEIMRETGRKILTAVILSGGQA